ncbi:hypothetical protein PFICI_05926 [Pestalotiopsis fici W106-1]|uniref:Uncharacterized protein n=1 Tax=Pestalotiopsis fici (strain W106-1 / CGMCC3.15140) TaxID=1229662 RepID=W3XDC0_PESFW|nr:uncharacterized protein PFICI_05926 [Pestalotiopsis fici W106-1]ETS84050.1 hypothetical protein PFICI_05926 [Pestalotiopsis fici W106-1]
MDQRQQQQQRRSNVPSERNTISRPQMFMHLEFGLSWSQRHAPQKHTITYTSRNLRDSRSRSSFPRQLPPPNANFLGPDASTYQPRPRASPDRSVHHYQQHQQQQQLQHHQQQRRRNYQQEQQEQEQEQRLQQQQQQQQQHIREHHRRQSRGYDPSIQFAHRPREVDDACGYAQDHERRRSRSESRGLSHDRGHSAPPPFHDSPWDDAPGLSASLFPPAQPAAAVATAASGNDQEALESVSKPLPATPSHFRLGEDGLPWSADAWPADTEQHGSQEQSSYTNQPPTVGIASGSRDDPQRVKELETLSAAMVTVDNGFENQWWYQGPRETTAWWPRDQEEPSRLSLADDLLFSATTEPADRGFGDDWYGPLSYNEESPLFDGIVSPVSTASPARPLQRSMTTRSEELFIMSDSR